MKMCLLYFFEHFEENCRYGTLRYSYFLLDPKQSYLATKFHCNNFVNIIQQFLRKVKVFWLQQRLIKWQVSRPLLVGMSMFRNFFNMAFFLNPPINGSFCFLCLVKQQMSYPLLKESSDELFSVKRILR